MSPVLNIPYTCTPPPVYTHTPYRILPCIHTPLHVYHMYVFNVNHMHVHKHIPLHSTPYHVNPPQTCHEPHLLQHSERLLHGGRTLVAVHEILPSLIQHKEDVEDLFHAAVAARGRLPLLSTMPMDRDARLAQVSQQEACLQEGALQKRPRSMWEGRRGDRVCY